MVRGSAIRVTELSKRGHVAPLFIPFAASRSVTSIEINEVVEPGFNELLRTDQDEPRVHFIKSDQTVRYDANINFLRCDPGILNLLTGVPLVMNAWGDYVGFDANSRLVPKAFALEVWSKLSGSACVPANGLGFGEGGFDTRPFGDPNSASNRRWGYTLFPFLKGGIMSGFAFDNGLVSFNIRSARAQRGNKWGRGPYPIEGQGAGGQNLYLHEPVSRNTNWRSIIVAGEPPMQTNGIDQFSDFIDGGDAWTTSADTVDGEFVVTSSSIVEGGYAL